MLSDFFRNPPRVVVEDSDWNSLLQQASVECVLPALLHQVQTAGSTDSIPPEISELFHIAQTLNDERNQSILSEAVHAAKLLNQIGIQPVALKGVAYLLAGVYPNRATRYLIDIDLLLPASDLRRAATHLCQHGYREDRSDLFVDFRHHHAGIGRPGLPQIELHHSVGIGICNHLLPAATIRARARLLKVDGAFFLIPSATDLANHLILHSQLAHPYSERIFPPLRALVDLEKLQSHCQDKIDWHYLARTYQDNGESATLELHLHQAHEILGLKIPPPVPTRLKPLLFIRYKRRQLLNRYPDLRLLDPAYLLMSLLSRRFRLVPEILRRPTTWPLVFIRLTRPSFYRNLID